MSLRIMRGNMLPNLLVALAACISGCAVAQAPAANDAQRFHDWLSAHHEQGKYASLSVLVLRDADIVVEAYFGHQDDEYEVPTSAATAYFVASVTKPIAGSALFLAHDQGVFDLDRPVTDSRRWSDSFCRWYPDSGIIFAGGQLDDITVPPFSCEDLTFRDVLHMQSNGTPGTNFLYNPIAFANLSRAFEDLTPMLFRDWLHRSIFEPAKMTNTAAGWRDRERGHVLSDLAMPHLLKDGKFIKQALPDDDLRSAAGLYMTPRDLARFDLALDDGKLMSNAQREAMWTPTTFDDGKPAAYTHGWYRQDWQGEQLIWHGGWEPEKYSAIYLKVPSRSVTLIALANTEGLYWGNPLNDARVHESQLVARFLEIFVSD